MPSRKQLEDMWRHEFHQLEDLWRYFTLAAEAKHEADEHKHVHMPPAMQQFMFTRVDELLNEMVLVDLTEQELRYHMVVILATMFDFAQICGKAEPPVVFDTLTPCLCTTFTTEDEKALLGGEE